MAHGNDSTLWHLMQLSGVSLLHADYASHHFAPHYHEELAIGVIQRGKLHVNIGKNGRMTLTPGHIVIINPGEIHEGFADPYDGCLYQMFYLPAKVLGKAMGLGDDFLPQFAMCALDDALVAQQLSWLHDNLTTPSTSIMAYESYLLETVNRLVGRYAQPSTSTAFQSSSLTASVTTILESQAYLAAHYDQKISLETLAAQTGLSPYHFLRVFKATVGMTPHAFQMQIRIDQAKSQLMRGEAIADVALDLGFHDQSHLTKQFKALVGVTPQRYRQKSNFLQDNHPLAD